MTTHSLGHTPEKVKCNTCGATIEKRQIHQHYHDHSTDTKGHSKGNCGCGRQH